jgi:hypothetical protein
MASQTEYLDPATEKPVVFQARRFRFTQLVRLNLHVRIVFGKG